MKNHMLLLLAGSLVLGGCEKEVHLSTEGNEPPIIQSDIATIVESQGYFNWQLASEEQLIQAIEQSGGVWAIGTSFSSFEERLAWLTGLTRVDEPLPKFQIDSDIPVIIFFESNENWIRYFLRDSNVRYVEPMNDPIVGQKSNMGCSANSNWVWGSDKVGHLPNTQYSWHWLYHGMPQVWNSATGTAIGVGCVDAGIISGQIQLMSQFQWGYSSTSRFHWPAYTYGASPYTTCTHGTSTSAIIGAPRYTGGLTGGAYSCNLVSFRASENVLLDTYSEKMAVKNAFIYLANEPQVHIISMSMGTPFSSGVLHDAVVYATTRNKLVFCAAGTSTTYTNNAAVIYPARYTECMAVTGMNENYAPCSTCHSGSEVDFAIVMERGVDANRTAVSLASFSGNAYYFGGSSVATASAAALAALVWSKNPSLSAMEVRAILEATSDFPNHNHGAFGCGRILADAAVQMASYY
jgi:serine protease